MKKIVTLLCILALTSACASSGTDQIGDFQLLYQELSSRGRMTKREIVATFGEPSAAYFRNGKEVYEYKYVRIHNNPASYIPLIGLMFKPNVYKINLFFVTFNSDGSVLGYNATTVSDDFPQKNTFDPPERRPSFFENVMNSGMYF